MYLTIVTLLIVASMTGYVMHLTRKYKEKLTCMATMMIAMAAGMMSSLLLGTVLGALSQGQLLIPTMISIVIGMAVGYYTGIPVDLMAALDGVMAGIMGGMMGAMLGVMVIFQSSSVMILFMNLIFIVVMYLLIKLIHQEAEVNTQESNENKQQPRNSGINSRKGIIAVIVVFLLIALFRMFGSGHGDSLQPISITPVARTLVVES